MGTKRQSDLQSGGFQFNNTGKVDIRAGGDIVARDKLTHTSVTHVFDSQPDKDRFASVLDEMKSLLQELRPEVDKLDVATEDKRRLAEGISSQLKILNTAKAKVATVPVGKAPKEKDAKTITNSLDHATKFVAHLKTFAKTTIGFGTLLAPIVTKLEPLIHTARALLGLG